MVSQIPTKLGRYEILEELGKGAMGVVYLAKDPLIGRLVALKTFHMGLSARDQELEQFRARFIREAQSAGILSHPNIVTIHDVVEESEEGATFIAMEYVRGTNLKELLQSDRPIDLDFVATVIGQVAEALEYAHSKGVVHRDVKPANIIIMADNRVKITDFGIARLDTSNLTQEGQLLGTPNYMAPEQIQGRDVDHRADIFSLGVVLYEMLTRNKPFHGENLTAVTHRIVYDQFTPPEEFVPGLPPGIQGVLTRALDKDPTRRYQGAREMARDLTAAVDVASKREQLNETQELEPIEGAGAPAREGALASLSGLLARLLPERGRRPSPLRLGIVSAAALIVALGAGWLAIAWAAPDGRPLIEDPAHRIRLQILPLLRQGHQMLSGGDPQGAVRVFSEAARLAPEKPRIRRLREEAERQAAQSDLAGRQEQMAADLAEAEKAFGARRYDDAAAALQRVLTVDPEQTDARALQAKVEVAQTRQHGRPAAPRPGSGAPVRPATTPVTPEPGLPTAPAQPVVESPPVPQDAEVQVYFYTELPEGILTVYADQQQMMREHFRFYQKSGLFRVKPTNGTVEDTLKVTAGTLTLRVYVAVEGRPTEVKTVSGNFPGGMKRKLDIRLSGDGQLTVDLL